MPSRPGCRRTSTVAYPNNDKRAPLDWSRGSIARVKVPPARGGPFHRCFCEGRPTTREVSGCRRVPDPGARLLPPLVRHGCSGRPGVRSPANPAHLMPEDGLGRDPGSGTSAAWIEHLYGPVAHGLQPAAAKALRTRGVAAAPVRRCRFSLLSYTVARMSGCRGSQCTDDQA
jgi:hypothetical protein